MDSITIERIGKNIRYLRKFYGETQEELGYAIGVEHNTISSYENARTEPDANTIALIADHYTVTPETITNSDLATMKDFDIVDFATIFTKHIDCLIPIIELPEEEKDEELSNVIERQKTAFEEIMSGETGSISKAFDCLIEYMDMYENGNKRMELIANFIGLWIVFLGVERSSTHVAQNNSAALKQVDLTADEIEKMGESFFSEEEYKEALSDLNDLLIDLRKSKYTDLAYYYMALRLILAVKLIDSDFSRTVSIGSDMMREFAKVKNKYAQRYLRMFLNIKKGLH